MAYRKQSSDSSQRRISFSWYRLVTNVFPVFANTGNPEFSHEETDRLFDFQISTRTPMQLTPASLYVARIADNESLAKKLHKQCIKEGLITTDPPGVDTKRIGKDFVHKFAFLPVYAQKKLICLLFAWEEELVRFRLLEEEEAEIKVVRMEEMRTGGRVGQLDVRLLELQGLKRLKPGMRSDHARSQDGLPAYAS